MLHLLLTPLAFAQAAPAALEVQVILEPSGEALGGASVLITRDGAVIAETQTDASGRFSVELPPGAAHVRVQHPDYPIYEADELLVAGRTARARYRVSEAGASITVVDQRSGEGVSRVVVSVEELRAVPGSFGDPVRALQSLPGVARPRVLEGQLVVRGAEGINTGYYVDGMPVPYMFHSLLGRSVISPSFIDEVAFFPGGLPSRYGEVTQAVVDVRTDTRPVAETRIIGIIDALDGSVNIERRLRPELSVRAAARYSWASAFIWAGSAISASRDGGSAAEATYLYPRYADLYGELRWTPLAGEALSLTLIASRDSLELRQGRFDNDGDGVPDEPEALDLPYDPDQWVDSRFVRLRARWRSEGEDHRSDTWVAVGAERQQNLLGASWLSREGPYEGRVEGFTAMAWRDDAWTLSEAVTLTSGARLTLRPVTVSDYQGLAGATSGEAPTSEDVQVLGGLWLEPQLRFGQWSLTPGMRLAGYAWAEQASLQPEPRLSWRYIVAEHLRFKGAVGRYTQLPPVERYAEGLGDPELPLLKAWQASVGAEASLPRGLSFDGSVYGGWMPDLIVRDLIVRDVDLYVDSGGAGIRYQELEPSYRSVRGLSYGVEGLLRVQPGQYDWWGWVALTLGRALRYDGERWFAGDYDQPVSLTLLFAYDLPGDWEASARWRATSGQPYTPLEGVYDPGAQHYEPLAGPLNSARYPWFRQLDLRVARSWGGRRVAYTGYVDVFNATWRDNPIAATYTYDYSERRTVIALPLIPTFGLEARF